MSGNIEIARPHRHHRSMITLKPARAVLSALLASTSIAAAGAQAARVTPERVRFVLTTLAHDSMEGRAMGTRGSMRAAAFIAEQFRLAGLTPGGDSGYFQHVPMRIRSIDP